MINAEGYMSCIFLPKKNHVKYYDTRLKLHNCLPNHSTLAKKSIERKIHQRWINTQYLLDFKNTINKRISAWSLSMQFNPLFFLPIMASYSNRAIANFSAIKRNHNGHYVCDKCVYMTKDMKQFKLHMKMTCKPHKEMLVSKKNFCDCTF